MSAEISRTVFVTGATGFIGSEVLKHLLATRRYRVICLLHRREPHEARQTASHGAEFVVGDINRPETYIEQLATCDTAVHMAAATGRANDAELHRINVEGTRSLLAACRERGVSRFVLMSSIAAIGTDIDDYPYALTKREAEKLTENSGLDHTIVRPTIVLGTQGGNWAMLRKIAGLPLVPVFGGGHAVVQPVGVTDVARGLGLILEGVGDGVPAIDIGGPERIEFRDFLLKIRHACGRRGTPLIDVPLPPVRALLNLAKRLTAGAFPVSAGQLAPFINNGIVEPNPVHTELLKTMAPLDALLQKLANAS